MLKGVLEGCVLEIISKEETYGYNSLKKLNSIGFDDVVEGTVYTILFRLEKNKLVDTQKKSSEIGPTRKFYSLNENGKNELSLFWGRWNYLSEKLFKLKEEQHVR